MIRSSLLLVVALLGAQAHAQTDHPAQVLQQLDIARKPLLSASMTTKEISPGCLATPIATTPIGPTWTFEVQTAAGQRVRGTAWRQPCSSGDAQFVLTLQPVSGTPFVCGTEIEIQVGGLRTDDLFLDVNPNDGVGTSFCANLAATTSFVLYEFDSTFNFDDDAAFTLVYESDVAADASTAIPAYDPSAYAGGGNGALEISGKLSGSYYAPARNGEGVLLEVGSIGTRRVLFLSWYTYFQGQQRWLVGNVDLSAGATEATIPLILTTGGQFGSAFDPSQVIVTAWGSATVQFSSCSTLSFRWTETGGASGHYNYGRSLERLDGVACP